jgi:hypothetical protein
MQARDLELYATRELIDELMRRRTFLGVVIHAEQELKTREWTGERVFTVHVNGNLPLEEAGRLLDVIAAHVDRLHDGPAEA